MSASVALLDAAYANLLQAGDAMRTEAKQSDHFFQERFETLEEDLHRIACDVKHLAQVLESAPL